MTIMEFQNVFSKYGAVDAKHIQHFCTAAGMSEKEFEEFDVSQIRGYLKHTSNAADYRDENGKECNKNFAKYVWVSTGVVNKRNTTVYIGFMRKAGSLDFTSYRVSNFEDLHTCLMQFLGELNINKEKAVSNVVTGESENFAKEIYDIMMMKGDRDSNTEIDDTKHLIKMMEEKVLNEIKKNRQDNFIWGEGRNKVLYNTGIVDVFGNDIMVILEVNKIYQITKRTLPISRTEIKKAGFPAKVDIRPLKFYRDPSELILDATIDDFDLTDRKGLIHILQERIERFPEDARGMSLDALCGRLCSSIELNLKICARDYKWAVPFYNPHKDRIQHLLPLYITKPVEGIADMAVVVGKGDEFYDIRTVLGIREAYFDAKALSAITCRWLDVR